MKLIDPAHPFYRRAWVRWLCAGVPLAWAAFEFATGEPMWGMIVGALGAYALWVLVLRWQPPEE